MAFEPLRGICAAPLLPMTPEFAIDWDSTRHYLDWIAGQSPAAIAMNMDASEGPSLFREEQLEVIRISRQAVAGRCPVYSGLIANSTADAKVLARELVEAGAEGLVVFPPVPIFLSKPVEIEMLVGFHQAVAESVDVPIVGFQFPVGMGPDFTAPVLEAMVGIPNFIGLKEASFDLLHTQQTIEAAGRLPRPIGVCTGSDTFILEAFIMGCDGALIGFAGTATDQLVAMQRAVAEGDYAAGYAIWDRLGPLARYCWRAPIRDYRPRMKEVLVMQGLIEHAAVRPPQLPVDDDERAELRRLALAAGLIGGAASEAAE
jgi:4-hydroxy-tetrahydrodipicolinate synthase